MVFVDLTQVICLYRQHVRIFRAVWALFNLFLVRHRPFLCMPQAWFLPVPSLSSWLLYKQNVFLWIFFFQIQSFLCVTAAVEAVTIFPISQTLFVNSQLLPQQIGQSTIFSFPSLSTIFLEVAIFIIVYSSKWKKFKKGEFFFFFRILQSVPLHMTLFCPWVSNDSFRVYRSFSLENPNKTLPHGSMKYLVNSKELNTV